MKRDLTEGSVLKNLIYFSLPYLLAYFLQTLYGMADLFIIGQFGSTADTTAVSVGSQVMHMITVMIVGLAMGTTVSIGRYTGARDSDGASRAIGNTVTLFAAVACALTVVLIILRGTIVSVMSTPTAAYDGTLSYLTVCFIGIPFITAYNVISAVFRGAGDSKSPMLFIAVACVTNILLDYLFIGALDMGPTGAALGTTASQAVSVIASLAGVKKRGLGIRIKRSDLLPDSEMMKKLVGVGAPVALQDGLIQISFIVITVFANRRGLSDAAAVGVVEKIIGIFFLVPSSMLSAVSALASQNLGAKKLERARLTLRYAVIATVLFGTVISLLTQVLASRIVGIFVDDGEVISLGAGYLKSYVFDCIFAGIHFCFSGYFCAVGKSGISFFHNIAAIATARIPIAYYASRHFPETLYPMGFSAPIGSLVSVAVCVAAYGWLHRRFPRKKSGGDSALPL